MPIIVLIVAAVIIGFVFVGGDDDAPTESVVTATSSEEVQQEDANISNSTISVVAENVVKSVLKSPSTADFPLTDYKVLEKAKNDYLVNSYVDSQNGFGAEVRSYYTVGMIYSGGEPFDVKNWEVYFLKFDDEVFMDNRSTSTDPA